MVVDTYHVWWDPDLQRQIARAGASGRIAGYQVCDWTLPLAADALLSRGHVGDGYIDFATITGWVAETGYAGDVEVEIFNQAIWDAPGAATVATLTDRYVRLVLPYRSGTTSRRTTPLRPRGGLSVRQSTAQRIGRLQALEDHDQHPADHLVGDEARSPRPRGRDPVERRGDARRAVLVALAAAGEPPREEVVATPLEQPGEPGLRHVVAESREFTVVDLAELPRR